MRRTRQKLRLGATMMALTLALSSHVSFASSHMDAPLITLDDAANTTDVYAFVDEDNGNKSLVVALGVYPFEEPGIGPNEYSFDPNVLYEIHLALGDDRLAGRKTLSYQFKFDTTFFDPNTILQAYRGVVSTIHDPAQNLRQTYTVRKVDHRTGSVTRLVSVNTGETLKVPPNNQGNATPLYNQDNNGENPARGGVATAQALDPYTAQAIFTLTNGYRVFAGQRDDGFYGDIQAIFDLLQLRSPGKDAQGGFNIHLIGLEIPLSELGGDQQIVGVYATTSRRKITVLSSQPEKTADRFSQAWVQVARQGNPLFNEALVAIVDKDLYNRTSPERDHELFRHYAESPELCRLINQIVDLTNFGLQPCQEHGRKDIASIYIPDLIKVDLSTSGVRLAGGVGNPDDAGFSRLGIFGSDILSSSIQNPFGSGGIIPGGWPNGRRFGDDVVDIAITALISTLPPLSLNIQGPIGDNVDHNDMAFHKVFPYESTPQNGRMHSHP